MGEESPDVRGFERALARLATEDSLAVAGELEVAGDAIATAARYSAFVNWLYGRKHLAEMTVFGRLGTAHCLESAQQIPVSDEARILELRGQAKTIAYNVSSNLWPGWNDEGIELSPRDLRGGLDLARLNLRLGLELKRGPVPLGNAHWLVGAHELAAGHADQAQASFQEAVRQFSAADKADLTLMAKGYRALAACTTKTPLNEPELRSVLESLRQLGQDGPFFADQIETASRILVK